MLDALGYEQSYQYRDDCFLGESRSHFHRHHPMADLAAKPGTIEHLQAQIEELGTRLTKAHAKADKAEKNSKTALAASKDADVSAAKAAQSLGMAKAAAESLRQSVVDQQSMISRLREQAPDLREKARLALSVAKEAKDSTRELDHRLTALDESHEELEDLMVGGHCTSEAESVAGRLEDTQKRLKATRRRVKAIEGMSYIKEESPEAATETIAAAAPRTPAIGDVAKTVGSAMLEGAMLGLTTQFIAEATDLMVAKALKAGLITPALAESSMFREGLKLGVPMMMLAASQYPQVPKAEFLGKVGGVAVKGQSAQHMGTMVAFGMTFVGEMLALPSAKNLEAQLSAAE